MVALLTVLLLGTSVPAYLYGRLRKEWAELETDIQLRVIPSPYRAFVGALVGYVNEVDARRGDDVATVPLPEYVPQHWWRQLLHNQPLFLLKAALLYRPGIVATSVPYHLR
jgi:hypothetical protein